MADKKTMRLLQTMLDAGWKSKKVVRNKVRLLIKEQLGCWKYGLVADKNIDVVGDKGEWLIKEQWGFFRIMVGSDKIATRLLETRFGGW